VQEKAKPTYLNNFRKYKKMYKLIILLSMSINILYSQNFKTSIEGNLSNTFKNIPITIQSYNFEENTYDAPILVAETDTNGIFSFKLNFPFLSLIKLTVGEKTNFFIGIENDATIKLSGKKETINISGSETVDEIEYFRSQLNSINEKYFGELMEIGNKALEKGDYVLLDSLNQLKEKNLVLFVNEFEQLVKNTKHATSAFYTMMFLDENKNLECIRWMSERLNKEYPLTKISKNVSLKVERLSKVSIGSQTPDFTSTDLSGNLQKPDMYRGKYLLLDFWASWCLPCRIENPKLAQLYLSTLRSKFEILGISNDKQKESFISAIEKDKVPWPQIFEGWNKISKMYAVNSLPQNVLINPEGKIIAKNIPMQELEKLLKVLLN